MMNYTPKARRQMEAIRAKAVRDRRIYEAYLALQKEGVRNIRAWGRLAERFHLSEWRIRDIICEQRKLLQ